MSGALSWVIWIAAVNAALAATACIAVWCVARGGGRPALVHTLWLVVLIRLLVPPVVAWPVLPAIDVEGWGDTLRSERLVTTDAAGVAHGELAPRWIESAEFATAQAAPISPPALLAIGWLIGSALIGVGALRRRRRMTKLLELTVPAPSTIRVLAAELARDLGLSSCPPVVVIEAHVSPMVWCSPGGLCVVLPAALLRRLPRGGLESVLAHELAHVRRRDHWTRRLELAVTLLCWWAPSLWWARAGLRRAEERCCDLWVVRVRPRLAATYARTLVETAAFVRESRESNRTTGRLPALASGAGPVRQLKERVTMIMKNDRRTAGATTSTLQRVTLAAVALAALAVAPVAIESTAGEPAGRDALARSTSELEHEVATLQQQVAELAGQRRALTEEIERLEQRRRLPVAPAAPGVPRALERFAPADPEARSIAKRYERERQAIERAAAHDARRHERESLDRERSRTLAEQELMRAELLRQHDRERATTRELRYEERELARELALDARERGRSARQDLERSRRMHEVLRGRLDALRHAADTEYDAGSRRQIEHQVQELQELMHEIGRDDHEGAAEKLDRSHAAVAELEALILEAEAAGELDEAKRLRRLLERDTAR